MVYNRMGVKPQDGALPLNYKTWFTLTPSLLALDSSYLLTRHFSLPNPSLVTSQWRLRRPDLSRISIEDY